MTKHVKNTHLDKLLDTGVVDHPVDEYVTCAQMTITLYLTRRTCRPLTYQSSFAPRTETQKDIILSSAALRDTLTPAKDPGVSEYLCCTIGFKIELSNAKQVYAS
jgi:hypothetical protein